jgi:hypothetical protein
VDESAMPPDIRGYLAAWREFRSDYGFVPRLIEHSTTRNSNMRVDSTDSARVRGGNQFIIDIKTGQTPAAAGIQLSAYSACLPRPLKGRNVTFTLRHSESLIIYDPGAVPEQWKRTTVTVDIPKDPLKRAIQAGEGIPGVHIEQRENLQRK